LLTLNEDLALPVAVPNDPVTNLPVAYPGGPLEVLVNNTKWIAQTNTGGCRGDFTLKTFQSPPGSSNAVTQCYSELPNEGATEVWEIVNLTADAHPMHLHAVQFQIINRQNFDVPKYNAVYNAAFPGGLYLPGYGPPLNYNTGILRAVGGNPDVVPFLAKTAVLPAPEEQGWKDTVVVMPGMVTRLAVRWAPTDLALDTPAAQLVFPFDPNGGHGYVWHCHIIDHEDNEMMRPTSIVPNTAFTGTRAYTNY
jgi:FtsP/CotA-like multicopper oxidase with cupredoxin domain